MSPRRPLLLALALGLVAAAAEARVVGITIERREPRPRRAAVRPRRPLRDAGRHRRARPRPFAAAEPGGRRPRPRPEERARRGRLHRRLLHPEARGPAPRQRARVLRGPQPRRQGHPAAAAVRRGLARPARARGLRRRLAPGAGLLDRLDGLAVGRPGAARPPAPAGADRDERRPADRGARAVGGHRRREEGRGAARRLEPPGVPPGRSRRP